MIRLVFVRHGQTVANVEGRWIGTGETSLTPLGQSQVEATARRLSQEIDDATALYTSPLRRARDTAAPIGQALGLVPVSCDDLREISFGDLEGVTLEEMAVRYPEIHARWQDKTDANFAWPGGDRRSDFFRRIAVACAEIVARHDGGTVIVVGHGGTIRACLSYLLPEELGAWWTYSVDNCGVTRVVVGEGDTRLVALNDIAHLSEMANSFS